MSTLVYQEGGELYSGKLRDRPLNFWKKFGKQNYYKYLYKGFRYYENGIVSVVVYSREKWSDEEKLRRKDNGFLGIREYEL